MAEPSRRAPRTPPTPALPTRGRGEAAASHPADSSVDPEEIARFSAIAEEWWRPGGQYRALHEINPIRLAFIKAEAARHFGRDGKALDALAGLRVLDIGCGGGLLTEPLARLGAEVTGIDAEPGTIAVARRHAGEAGLAIDYRAAAAEDLAAARETFDIVLAMEVVEHVADRGAFIRVCGGLIRPGGLFLGSTINRTLRSFALAIVGAEYVLGWVPRGTHHWSKLVTPEEFRRDLRAAGLTAGEIAGIVFDPFGGGWRRSADTAVNYMLAAAKAADKA